MKLGKILILTALFVFGASVAQAQTIALFDYNSAGWWYADDGVYLPAVHDHKWDTSDPMWQQGTSSFTSSLFTRSDANTVVNDGDGMILVQYKFNMDLSSITSDELILKVLFSDEVWVSVNGEGYGWGGKGPLPFSRTNGNTVVMDNSVLSDSRSLSKSLFVDGENVIKFVVRGNSPMYFDAQLTGLGTPAPTPIPAAAWLFGSGLAGLVALRRKTA